MLEQNDELVRQLEAELLDRNHLCFPLLLRSKETAISHLLKIVGDLLREIENGEIDHPWSSLHTFSKTIIGAAEHALRWLQSACGNGSHGDSLGWKQGDAEALDLLSWAVHYAQLYADHTAWSRGMMNPLVDSESKTIVFDYSFIKTQVLMDQIESDIDRGDAFENSIPRSIDESIVTPWLREFREDHLYDLPPVPIDRETKAYRDAERWAASIVFPDIRSDLDLGGFTLDQFRRFYLGLWIECRGVTKLEDFFDSALGSDHFFGSRLLQNPRDDMIKWLSDYCDLPETTVETIVERLTFDLKHRHPSLPGHLFVPTTNGTLTMLPRLFACIDPNQMLSTALNTGATRRIYESIIGEIEIAAKNRLAEAFRKHDYAVWDMPSLPRSGIAPLTPDLVIGKDSDDRIAIIEYKHALAPLGAAGVSDRIKEADKWIGKAKKYLLCGNRQHQILQKHLGIPVKDRHVIVAIVPRWPMPVPLEIDSEDIYIADVARVERRIGLRVSVTSLFGPNSESPRQPMKRVHHDIQVGDWTYKHPILIPETETAHAFA